MSAKSRARKCAKIEQRIDELYWELVKMQKKPIWPPNLKHLRKYHRAYAELNSLYKKRDKMRAMNEWISPHV